MLLYNLQRKSRWGRWYKRVGNWREEEEEDGNWEMRENILFLIIKGTKTNQPSIFFHYKM